MLTCGLACLVVAACGSSSTSSGSSSAAAAASSASRAKLVACLKQHGVSLPARPAGGFRRPPGNGTGTTGGRRRPPGGFGAGGGGFFGRSRSDPKLAAAFKACGGPAGFGGRPFNAASRKTEINKFVTCVAQHGYKLPKPNLTGNGPEFPTKIESDAKFRTAARSCQSLLAPRGGPGPGPPPSAGSAGGASSA